MKEQQPKELQEFYKRLRKIRIAKKLTQEDVAEKINTNRNYYAQIERNQRKPSFHVILKLVKALDINLASILYKDVLEIERNKSSVKGYNSIILRGELVSDFKLYNSNDQKKGKMILQVRTPDELMKDDFIEVIISNDYRHELKQKAKKGDCIKVRGYLRSNIKEKETMNSKFQYEIHACQIKLLK